MKTTITVEAIGKLMKFKKGFSGFAAFLLLAPTFVQ